MTFEIEHKFLLKNNSWRQQVEYSEIFRQGYLSSKPTSSIRIRICGSAAWINIKSATVGSKRLEFEYPIPVDDAIEILSHIGNTPLIEKTRHYVYANGDLWEIDEFEGANKGLLVAEIELESPDQSFVKPDWCGLEVTNDLRYYNNNLATNPFCSWQAE